MVLNTENKEISKLLIEKGADMLATLWAQFTFYSWAEEDTFFLEKIKEAHDKPKKGSKWSKIPLIDDHQMKMNGISLN